MVRRTGIASARASINVTPLIDVLLVLLLLFMVASPVARPSLDTGLPRLGPPTRSDSVPAVVLEIDTGGLKLNGAALVSTADLARRVRDLMAVRSDRTLYVRASGSLSYGTVVGALDVARGSGVERIGLIGLDAAARKKPADPPLR